MATRAALRVRPSAVAATSTRPIASVVKICFRPSPRLPTMADFGTRQPSKNNSQDGAIRQPILRPGLPIENPGVPTGTAKVDNPFDPLSGSVTATTVVPPWSGVPALVENTFEPSSTKSLPSSRARVLICATSEPPCGSVTPNDARVGPRHGGPSHCRLISSEPKRASTVIGALLQRKIAAKPGS